MAGDFEQVLREAESAIASQCERAGKRTPDSLQGDPDDEIARYRALVLHHADMLGSSLVELQQWLEKGTAAHPISQRRPRGRERSTRLPNP